MLKLSDLMPQPLGCWQTARLVTLCHLDFGSFQYLLRYCIRNFWVNPLWQVSLVPASLERPKFFLHHNSVRSHLIFLELYLKRFPLALIPSQLQCWCSSRCHTIGVIWCGGRCHSHWPLRSCLLLLLLLLLPSLCSQNVVHALARP
jgi:hypothetical protein